MQNIHHLSGIHISVYFIKDTLVSDAQLNVNTLSEPVLVNSHMSVCIIEKGIAGMAMPGFGGNKMHAHAGYGMWPAPGQPPGEEDSIHLFKDNIIWYKLSLQHTGI